MAGSDSHLEVAVGVVASGNIAVCLHDNHPLQRGGEFLAFQRVLPIHVPLDQVGSVGNTHAISWHVFHLDMTTCLHIKI